MARNAVGKTNPNGRYVYDTSVLSDTTVAACRAALRRYQQITFRSGGPLEGAELLLPAALALKVRTELDTVKVGVVCVYFAGNGNNTADSGVVLTAPMRKQMRELASAGHHAQAIADAYGVKLATVRKHAAGLLPNGRPALVDTSKDPAKVLERGVRVLAHRLGALWAPADVELMLGVVAGMLGQDIAPTRKRALAAGRTVTYMLAAGFKVDVVGLS